VVKPTKAKSKKRRLDSIKELLKDEECRKLIFQILRLIIESLKEK